MNDANQFAFLFDILGKITKHLSLFIFDNKLNLIIANGELLDELESPIPSNTNLNDFPDFIKERIEDGCKRVLTEKEFFQERMKGTDYYYESFVPIKQNGQITQILAVVKRFNDLKVFTSLLENEEKFRTIFERSGTPMAVVNSKGQYTLCNKGFEELIGYSKDEIKLLTIADLTFPEDLTEAGQKTMQLLEGKVPNYTLIKRFKRKDRKICWVEMTVSLFNVKSEQEPLLLGTFKDITLERKARRKLEETNEELSGLSGKLIEYNAQLENFAHITSHDLRSPVGNLVTLVEKYEKVDENGKKNIRKSIKNIGKNLQQTVNELTDLLQHKRQSNVIRERVLFQEVMDKIKVSISEDLMESFANLSYDFSACESIVFPKQYLESIMLNFLTNAIKYRKEDIPLKIEIRTYTENGCSYLTVKDNGIGIDMSKDGNKLFKIYSTLTNHPEAKGVGLYLVKNQVESEGGSIKVESQLGVGSTFTVEFKN